MHYLNSAWTHGRASVITINTNQEHNTGGLLEVHLSLSDENRIIIQWILNTIHDHNASLLLQHYKLNSKVYIYLSLYECQVKWASVRNVYPKIALQ